MTRGLWGALVAALALTYAGPADAHLMPSKQGTIHVVDDSAFVVLSVPVSALHGFDDDGDGLLGTRELAQHQAALRAEIDGRLVVTDGDVRATTVLVNLVLSPAHDAPTDRADHVVALKHARFAAAPRDLGVAIDLFGARDDERQISVTATRGPNREAEVAILTPRSPAHHFFRAPLATFAGYARTGVEHILFGADHLLFLLTILIAGWETRSWRYWARVISAFTVAHSVTLVLASLGYVHAPGRIVEPLIALSIAGMAADNLRSRQGRARVAVVGACGLLHGLGFASSMDAMGLDGVHRIVSLAGFNVGVELGQGAFLAATLGVLFATRRMAPRAAPHLARAVSLAALVLGSAWVIQRVVS